MHEEDEKSAGFFFGGGGGLKEKNKQSPQLKMPKTCLKA